MFKKFLFNLLFLTLLSGCGGSGGSEATNPISLTISGTLSGLIGSLELQNNGEDSLIINENGTFVFSLPLVEGDAYNVTVLTQPSTQSCVVTNGTGIVGADDVLDIQVSCSTNTYTVGGTVSGLAGNLGIENNSSDTTTLSSNGSFTFATPVEQGGVYNVTVSTQPDGYTCIVTNGSGTMSGANVTNVSIDCTENAPTLSAISPTVGPVTGGTVVTFTGTNLTNTSSVTFDGIAATSIVVVNSTTITAVAPSHSAGLVDVAITTAGGTASLNSSFTYQPLQTLTVAKGGTELGTIISSPTGINCGVDCTEDYANNAVVTLSATPATDNVFAGWSGDCTGLSTCEVTMDSAKNVTATFEYGVAHLTASVEELNLSVNDTATSSYLSGNSRVITITNNGTATARNVIHVLSTALPSGASILSTCADLAIESSCTFTVTPSSTPTAAIGDLGALPVDMSITADGANTVVIDLNIVTYGSYIGGGYVFAINDTVPSTGSAGIDVVTPDPVGIAVEWSTDVGGSAVLDDVQGVSETSVSTPTTCAGNLDGVCNTDVITSFYPTIPLANYAAGTCAAYGGGGFTDWYLPAICELSYSNDGAGCGTELNPTLQNIQSNVGASGLGSYDDFLFWSSTSYSGDTTSGAWFNAIGPASANANNSPVLKSNQLRTICVRRL